MNHIATKSLSQSSLPHGWEYVAFGDIVSLSQYGLNTPSVEGSAYPMLRMNNLQLGKLNIDDLVYVNLTKDELKKFSLQKGDLLINRTNSYELVGKTALFELNEPYVFASYLVRFRLDSTRVIPKYVCFWFNSNKGQESLKKIVTKGVSQANINPTILQKQYFIILPPLPEQIKIVEILSAWDEAINLTEQEIATKQKRKQALMHQLLTGKTRFPGFKEVWKEYQLGELASLTAGGTPSTKVEDYWGGNIRWMNSGEINLRYVHEVEGRITQSGLDNSSAKLILQNSVMIALAGQGKTRGMVAINKVETATNQSIAAIMPMPTKLYYLFLFFNLDSRYSEMRSLSGGDGGRGGLNLTILKNITISLPPLEEQKKIADALYACDEELDLLKQKLDALRQQKKGLMQQLLTGKIRVKI